MRRTAANIAIIFVKELLETLRDRRTLILTVFLPIIIYPLLILGMSQLIVSQIGKMEQKKIPVAFKGDSAILENGLKKDGRFEIIRNIEDVREGVRRNEVVLGIEVPGDFDEEAMKMQKNSPRLILYYSKTNENSRLAVYKLESLVQELLDGEVRLRLEKLQQPPDAFLSPFRIIVKNTAEAREEGAFEFGPLLALLVVMMAVSFTLYPAIDMGAGEKERGTMETLLISSARREEIVLGKYLAVFTIALLGSLLNILSMALTFGHFAHIASQQLQRKGIQETELSREHTGMIKSVALLPKNRAVSADENGAAVVWDLKEKTLVWERTFDGLTSFAVDPAREFGLIGDESGSLWRWNLEQNECHKVYENNAGPVVGIAFSQKNMVAIAVENDAVSILDCSSWETAKKLDCVPGTLVFSTSGQYLAVYRQSLFLIALGDGSSTEIPEAITAAVFSPDGQHLLCGNAEGQWSIYRVPSGERVWSAEDGGEGHQGKITAVSFFGDTVVSASVDATIQVWQFSPVTPQLSWAQTIEGDESPIMAVDFSPDGRQYLSGNAEGSLTLWKERPHMSFSLPFSVFLMILVVLIPMLGLFSAISLALSVFAQTYKEASYYLTPLMIVVMPLMMVALVPAVSLTLGRCLIPVAGVVLLYKELFMGQMNLSHIVLVLTAHLTYAALALVFTIRLFQRESVLFREAQERRWEFWSAGREKQEVFTFHQAMAIFLLAMVFFYFVGPYLAQWHFVAGQVINQIAFLMVFPVLGALLFRLDLKKTFYGKVPRLSEVLSSLLLAVGGLVLARELSVLQRTLIPSDIAHLKEMQKILEKATEGISPLWILVGFSLVPGVCEELFFRGLLLSSCRRQMSTAKSVGLTAFLFAMMHMNFANFTFYLTLGFVLGYLVVRTGSILAAMIAHLANNGLAVVAGSCLRDTALYGTLSDPQAFLPWWITSGALFVFALGLYTLKMQRK